MQSKEDCLQRYFCTSNKQGYISPDMAVRLFSNGKVFAVNAAIDIG